MTDALGDSEHLEVMLDQQKISCNEVYRGVALVNGWNVQCVEN